MESIGPALVALPLFMATLIAEALWYHFKHRDGYPWADSGVSMIAFAGRFVLAAIGGAGLGILATIAWNHRLLTIPMGSLWSWVGLFLAVEFAYYWLHRCSHEIRWLWATHVVHHSAPLINFATGARLGWTNGISGTALFLVPLSLVGFDPVQVAAMYSINVIYQFWLHTELVPKLGPLEWVLNTPSHHRVHHALNPVYIDRNYGGIVIIWDRLFGTFVEERSDIAKRYGAIGRAPSRNIVTILFSEWLAIFRDLLAARTWRQRVLYAFGPPGWSPDGSRLTSAQVRAQSAPHYVAPLGAETQPL